MGTPQTPPRRRRRSARIRVGVAAGAILLAALVVFALSRLELHRIGHALITATPGWIVLALVLKAPVPLLAIVVALACLRAGAALLPLNTAYTLAELEYFLGDAEPALTLCRPELLSSARQLADKLGLPFVESLGVARDGTFAEKIAAEPSEFETVPRGPDDLAAVLYTSGTTGRPNSASLHLSCYAPVRLLLPTCYRHANSLLSDRRRRSAPAFSRRPHCVGSAAAPGRRRVSRAFRRRSFRGVPCALTRLRGLGQNRGLAVF